jgi:hypothetical protein
MLKLILRLAFVLACLHIARQLNLDGGFFRAPTLGYFEMFAQDFYDFIVGAPNDLQRVAGLAK